jgi:uncharacterized membrane protein
MEEREIEKVKEAWKRGDIRRDVYLRMIKEIKE